MKKISLLLCVFCLLMTILFLLLTGGCTKTVEHAGTLKIGLIASITGPMSTGIQDVVKAAKPTQELINKTGGITVKGQKYDIEIVVEDDQSTPPGAVAAANKLIGDDIKFIISSPLPPFDMAIAPICEEAKVIRITPAGPDAPSFTEEQRYFFNAYQTSYNIAPVYDYLQKNYPNVKKVALIALEDPGIAFPYSYTIQQIEERGLQLVAQERYPAQIQDFYPILTKALTSKPDAIDSVGGLPMWAAGMSNQARELGFTGPIFCGCMFGDINLTNSMIDTQFSYDIFEASPDVLSDKMPPIVKELRALIEEQTGGPFTFDSVNPLLVSMCILQGIEEAQSFNTDDVLVALESMKEFDTPYGKATWSGADLAGINHQLKFKNTPFSRIMNNKVEFEFLK